ncbi:MAG: hypothetical protein GY869_09730 [Planctomycetes bacterium]|nr:hypothetical protein [Planctomycetota bacterium]
MIKKWQFRTATSTGLSLKVITLILLGVLITAEASGQGRNRNSRNRSRTSYDSGSAPVEKSEVNLETIPYKIVYETYRKTDGKNNWEICIVDANGENLINLTNTPDVNELYPHASPDGAKICFVADEGTSRRNKKRNVYYMNVDGTGRTKVVENGRQPCWSADSKSIAYLKGEYSRYSSDAASNRGLVIYNLQTKKHQNLPNQRIQHAFNLCWSPDGKWFTATSRGRGGNIAIPIDGSREKSLGIRGCRPDISPDGTKLSWGRSDNDLMIADLNLASRRSNVTNSQTIISCRRGYKVYHVDWSPDGKYLTLSYGPSRGSQAVGSRAEGWNICIYEIASEKWVQITTDGNHNKEPDWVYVKPANRPDLDK